MNKTPLPVYALITVLFLSGCDETFSPKGPFEPRIVVFGALSSVEDTQYVRVYTSYDADQNNPFLHSDENPVRNALVTIRQGANVFTLRDTVVPRAETDRYPSSIVAYYAAPLRATPTITYTLTVQTAVHGMATSSVTVPDRGDIFFPSLVLITNPWAGSPSRPAVQVSARISSVTKGFRFRMFVEYEATFGSRREVRREEVPTDLRVVSCFFEQYEYLYSTVVRRQTQVGREGIETYAFNEFAYRRTVEMVFQRNLDVRFLRAVFYLVQYESNWYNYYQTTNRSKDRYTTRLDETDFSNIQGGLGVFGAFSVDSAFVVLPEVLLPPPNSSPCK